MMAAAKLDEYWSHLRLSQTDLPGRKFLLQAQEAYQRVSVQRQTVVEVAHEEAKLVSPRLAEALVRYVSQKGAGRVDTFRRAAERACGYLIDAAGEKPLSDYTRSDALSLRDYLVAKGLSGSSITRILGSIRAVINFNIGELALGLPRSSGPISVLVHNGSWRYGRGGRRSGSRWRSRPLHHLRGRGAIAQR